MSFLKHITLYENLKKLIEAEKTGSPLQLAEKLNISERQVYNYIKEMNHCGENIAYCKKRQTYHYNRNS
jgi:transcriptional antiterminator